MNDSKRNTPWGEIEKKHWLDEQVIKRSYQEEVVDKILKLDDQFEVVRYGTLPINPKKYPLFLIHSKSLSPKKKTVLITGGVHGYETSGIHGALRFLKSEASKYLSFFNIVVAPCISPWGYETINRWNPSTIDPNRSFMKDSKAMECRLLMEQLNSMGLDFSLHIDLHETTDTDNSIFRPALESRDGVSQDLWDIPDGFYIVGDSHNPTPDFQKAVIDAVRSVTHIAKSDKEGRLIGENAELEGVINYPVKSLFLCSGMTSAKYCTTTEVYPDSPRANALECELAQVAAIVGGLDFLKTELSTHQADPSN